MFKKVLLVSIIAAALATSIILFAVFKKEPPQNNYTSEDGTVMVSTTEVREMYTKESLLDELLGKEPFEVKEEHGVRTEKFQNGAVATIKDGEVKVKINDQEFDYSISQYRVAVPYKEIPTTTQPTSETQTTEPTTTQPTTTQPTTTQPTETTTKETQHVHNFKAVKHKETYIDHSGDFEEKTYVFDLIRDGKIVKTYKTYEEANEAKEETDIIQTRETGNKTNHDADVQKEKEVIDYYKCTECGARKDKN